MPFGSPAYADGSASTGIDVAGLAYVVRTALENVR